jgi:Bacteriocin-protection, YdeI or OmpD-Associated/Domain of unknown function (DUF1905)
MPRKHEFAATLFKGGDEANASFFVEVPPEVVADFGKKGQVRVKVTLDGQPFRLALAPYGGKHLMVVRKEVREAIGKSGGDTIHIIMEVDTEPRIVDVPHDLVQALGSEADANTFFDKLSYSHRKEYVEWINEAKKAETRTRRIEKAVQMMKAGTKTPRSS